MKPRLIDLNGSKLINKEIYDNISKEFYYSHSTLQLDLDSFYKEHDIQHIMEGIEKPTVLGKIERWNLKYDIKRPSFKRWTIY